MKRMVAVAVAAALAVLAACGGGAGGSSPQDVFDSAKNAGTAKDYKAMFACVDPEGRDQMLFASVLGVGFASMGNKDVEKEMEALQKKYGIKESKGGAFGDKDAMKAAAKEAFADVKDKPALFADLMALMEKHAKNAKTSFTDMGTLKDVAITGDTAKAKEVRDGKEKEIAFVKRENRWYLAME